MTDIREARSAGQSYRALSMDAPAGEARDLADLHGVRDPGYARVEAAATVQAVMTALSDRERDVITMRFNEGLLQREIAEKIGVSQMQVSRILMGAVERMSDHVAESEIPPIAA